MIAVFDQSSYVVSINIFSMSPAAPFSALHTKRALFPSTRSNTSTAILAGPKAKQRRKGEGKAEHMEDLVRSPWGARATCGERISAGYLRLHIYIYIYFFSNRAEVAFTEWFIRHHKDIGGMVRVYSSYMFCACRTQNRSTRDRGIPRSLKSTRVLVFQFPSQGFDHTSGF